MAQVVIVYWRDIPAQIVIGRGRGAAKHPLPERFEQAIDRAAMRAGLAGSDDYLSQWRRCAVGETDNPDAEAHSRVAQIDAEFTKSLLLAFIENKGFDPKIKET